MNLLSDIIDNQYSLKIISYFPEERRNFKVQNIYKGSRDGWTRDIFDKKVFGKGPLLMILKTKNGEIFGGYTTKNWGNFGYFKDNDAFLFDK